MTLAQQIIDDATNVFLKTDDFAEQFIYCPFNGNERTITAIAEMEEDLKLEDGIDGLRREEKLHIWITVDDTNGVASPGWRDYFIRVSNNKKYKIVPARPEVDSGMQRLQLTKIDTHEVSTEGYRKKL